MSRSAVQSNVQTALPSSLDWGFWSRWILANTIGELVGLGTAAFVGILFTLNFEHPETTLLIVSGALVMILVGTFEGVVVGVAQSYVLRRSIENFNVRDWIIATAIGAFVAWTLGGIPSIFMSLQEQATAGPPPEMSDMAMYGLAMLMGLALGFTLGVLRKYDDVRNIGLVMLFVTSLVAIPVYLTGEPAEEIVEKLPGVSEQIIELHEDAAIYSLVLCIVVGVLALLALVAGRFLSDAIAKIATFAVLAITLLAGASMAYTANLGGQVRHTEIRGSQSGTTGTESQKTEKKKDKDDDD